MCVRCGEWVAVCGVSAGVSVCVVVCVSVCGEGVCYVTRFKVDVDTFEVISGE